MSCIVSCEYPHHPPQDSMTQYNPDTIAVIFSAKRNTNDDEGYAKAAAAMVKLAKQQKGFVDIDSVRDQDGNGITISYWQSEEDAIAWRDNETHTLIRDKGRSIWYDVYSLQIAKIERSYDWKRDEG